MKNIYKMAFIALLTAQALVLYWVETMIPLPLALPGAKLGLANIFTVVSLYLLNALDTFLVVILRVVISMFISNNLQALLYSMSGAILSFIGMLILKIVMKDRISRIGISVAGAMFHNFGQLIVASIMVNNFRILTLMPILTAIAIPTGIFVGMVANYMLEHLKKLPVYRKIKKQSRED